MTVAETLKERFGLDDVLVVPSEGNYSEVRARVASASAFILRAPLPIAILWGFARGQTILEVGEALDLIETQVEKVCQMVGIARTQCCGSWPTPVTAAWKIRWEPDVMQFPAPGVVSTKELYDQLVKEPIVAEQFAALHNLDAAVFGIALPAQTVHFSPEWAFTWHHF